VIAATVAHVVLRLDVGGLERMVVQLLTLLDRKSFAPRVCVLGEKGALAAELEALGVPVESIPRRGGRVDPTLPIRLARWFKRQDVDIVHTHNPAPHLYGALGAGVARAGGRTPRVVHTKHGRNVPHTRKSVTLNQLASAMTNRIVTVSDDARAVALEVEGVDAAKVVTIKNGVDTTLYRPRDRGARDLARQRLGLPEGGYHIVCVARLSEEKDHATLLAAFARLRAALPDARLALVGDGPERPALEALAHRLAPGAVLFTGMRSDVAELLPAFDAFALASRTEGISLTLLEAAAAGLPIVATRVGGNPEVVTHGRTGLLVPPVDPARLAAALEELAKRPDRAEMGLAGRRRVETLFGVQSMVGAYEALYRRVLEPP